MYTTVFAHAAKHGSLALAVVVHRQPIAEHRLIHVKALGVPYVRLEPHFRLASGGHRGTLASRVQMRFAGRRRWPLSDRRDDRSDT